MNQTKWKVEESTLKSQNFSQLDWGYKKKWTRINLKHGKWWDLWKLSYIFPLFMRGSVVHGWIHPCEKLIKHFMDFVLMSDMVGTRNWATAWTLNGTCEHVMGEDMRNVEKCLVIMLISCATLTLTFRLLIVCWWSNWVNLQRQCMLTFSAFLIYVVILRRMFYFWIYI